MSIHRPLLQCIRFLVMAIVATGVSSCASNRCMTSRDEGLMLLDDSTTIIRSNPWLEFEKATGYFPFSELYAYPTAYRPVYRPGARRVVLQGPLMPNLRSPGDSVLSMYRDIQFSRSGSPLVVRENPPGSPFTGVAATYWGDPDGRVRVRELRFVGTRTFLRREVFSWDGDILSAVTIEWIHAGHRYCDFAEMKFDDGGLLIEVDIRSSMTHFADNLYRFDEHGRLTSHQFFYKDLWGLVRHGYEPIMYDYDQQGRFIESGRKEIDDGWTEWVHGEGVLEARTYYHHLADPVPMLRVYGQQGGPIDSVTTIRSYDRESLLNEWSLRFRASYEWF